MLITTPDESKLILTAPKVSVSFPKGVDYKPFTEGAFKIE